MQTVQIKGLDDLRKAFEEFPVKVEVNGVRGGLRKAAQTIAAAARSEVPVETGGLRASIRTKTWKNTRTGYLNYPVIVGSRGKPGGKLGTAAYYAHMVHGGTQAHKIFPRKFGGRLSLRGGHFARAVRHPGARANPFLSRAWSAAQTSALAAYEAYLVSAINRATRLRAAGRL